MPPCWLKTVVSLLRKGARGHGVGPGSLPVQPFRDAGGGAERDRRTRTHPVSAVPCRIPTHQVSQHVGPAPERLPASGHVVFAHQLWYTLNIQGVGAGASIEIL